MGHSNPSKHSECGQFQIRTGVRRALSQPPVAGTPPASTPLLSKHLSHPWSFSVMGFLIVGGTRVFHSDPSDYKQVIPCLFLHWGESPLLDLLSCWLFVALLIAFPKPHEPLWRNTDWFHFSLVPLQAQVDDSRSCPAPPSPLLDFSIPPAVPARLLAAMVARVVFILFTFCYFSLVTNIFQMQTYKSIPLF